MKNVVLLTVDCLRYDHLHYMEQLMSRRNKASFTHFFSNAPFTGYSISSLLTSLYPPVDSEIPTVTDVLHRHGFATGAFVPNPMMLKKEFRWVFNSFDHARNYITDENSHETGTKRAGLDDLLSTLLKKSAPFIPRKLDVGTMADVLSRFYFPPIYSKKISDEAVLHDALHWIQNRNRPFFVWVHLMGAHNPYISSRSDAVYKKEIHKINFKLAMKIKEEWGYPITCDVSADIHAICRLYTRAIKHIDGILDTFLEELPPNTLAIVTADHGEQFLEHGSIQHMFWHMYEEQIHIPCVMFDSPADADVDGLHSLVDVGPTIAEAVGIDYPFFMGKSLYGGKEKPVVVRGRKDEPLSGIRTHEWKLFEMPGQGWKLFNLVDDPEETTNMIHEERDIAEGLQAALYNDVRASYQTQREIKRMQKIKDIG